MPIGEDFYNPYRMISPRRVQRERPLYHDRFAGISGVISGRAKALTPVFVGGSNSGQFFRRRDNKYCIPATSFKGMLRSLVEIVGAGCDIVKGRNAGCTSNDELCVACRLFGMSVSGQANILHQGKVFVGDLPLLGVWDEENQRWNPARPVPQSVLLSGPRPRHRAFYGTSNKRKVYHQQPATWSNISPGASQAMISQMASLPVDSEFELHIRMENLTEGELALLLYCLELEGNIELTIEEASYNGHMRHKIGGGKPLGFGTIELRINPQRGDFFIPADRYQQLGRQDQALAQDMWDRIDKERQKYCFGGDYDCNTLRDLRKMMLFLPDDPRDFHYPDQGWFKTNSNTSLKPI